MPYRVRLLLVTLILLMAAALRIVDLTRLPPGFSDEEINNISIAQAVRGGTVASFYNVGDPLGGREGLFPSTLALVSSILGDGLLPIRMLSVWCGILAAALTYALARRLFKPYVAFVAVIALALTMWPILLSRSAVREALLLPLTVATLIVIASAFHLRDRVQPEAPDIWTFTLLGLMLAILAYTHWTGLVLVPLYLAFLAYLVLTRQPIARRALNLSGFALLIMLIIGIPYIAFSLRALRLSGLYIFWLERPESLGALLESAVRAIGSLGLSGDPMVQHNLPGLPLLGPLALILFLIGLVEALRRWREPNYMLVLMALGFGVLTDAWTRGAPNFTDLILALPAIMALIGIGAALVVRLLSGMRGLPVARLVTPVTVGLTLVSGVLAAYTLLTGWRSSEGLDSAYRGTLGRLAAYLDRTTDDLSTSICTFDLDDTGRTPINVNPEQPDPVLLDWMMHRPHPDLRFSNCLSGFVLTRGGERQRVAYAEAAAAQQIAPQFERWLTNVELLSTPGIEPGTLLLVDAAQAVADDFGVFTLRNVAFEPGTSGPSDQAALPLRMGGYLTFEGYELQPSRTLRPGEVLTLVTYWRADGEQVPGLRLFAHVGRNPNTEPVLQHDILSIDAARLRDRDVFIQLIAIPIPPRFPPGEYYLSIGAYSSSTGQRLPVYDENQVRGDRLFLDRITVVQ